MPKVKPKRKNNVPTQLTRISRAYLQAVKAISRNPRKTIACTYFYCTLFLLIDTPYMIKDIRIHRTALLFAADINSVFLALKQGLIATLEC
jgi:hypothetical protein